MATRLASFGSLRTIATVVVGGSLHVVAILAAVRWLEWDGNRVTAACAPTDCQPQYYLATGLGFFALVLPTAYCAGWTSIVTAGWASAHRTRPRLVGRLIIAAPCTSIVLIGYSVWLASLPAGDRWNAWIGAIALVPVLVGTIVAATTPATGDMSQGEVAGPSCR